MKLYLSERSWSGVENYTPVTTKHEYELRKDYTYVVSAREISYKNEYGEWVTKEEVSFSFKIIDILDDSIEIETNIPLSYSKNSKINLNSNDTKFKILKDEVTELVTTTMDSGYTYIFELK